MDTSGRRWPHAGGLLTLGAALALAGTAAAAHRPQRWCELRSNAAWRHVLARHVVPLSRTTSLVAWAMAHDGRSFFASVYSPAFSGVARISATKNQMTRIRPFPDPNNDQAGGAFDGRWLVWREYHGFDSFDDFTVWAWDSRTGRVGQIGASTPAPGGGFWESPWRDADVRKGVATWVQGSGPNGVTRVHLYDLRAGVDRVIHIGHAQGSFLLADHLVAWPESPSRGARTRIYAASTLSGLSAPVPRALRGLRGISGLATNGRRIAYPDGSYRSLWWAPSLHSTPQKIVAARGLNYIDNSVQIGGRYIGFGIQPRVFIGDTKTHRYVEVGAHGGGTQLDSTALLVAFSSRVKKLHPLLRTVFVPLRDLPPMPYCG